MFALLPTKEINSKENLLQEQLIKESQEDVNKTDVTTSNENQAPIAKPEVITVEYFKKLVERVSDKNSQPLIGWKIKYTAEIAVQLINQPNEAIGILKNSIIAKPHFSRSGICVIDAICNHLYSNFISESNTKNEKKQKEKERARFLYKVDTVLYKIFEKLLETDRKRSNLTLRPTSTDENKKHQFSAKNKSWIQKMLNHWWKHKYFSKKTIKSIITLLHLMPINELYEKEMAELRNNTNQNKKRKYSKNELTENENQKKRKLNLLKKEEIKRKINILELPNELLVKIFSYLNIENLLNLSTVNKKFFEISFDPCAWKNLKIIRKYKNKFTHEVLKKFKNQLQFLEIIDLSYCNGINDESILFLSSLSNQIKYLSIEGCFQLNNVSFLTAIILANSNSLEYLNLSLTTGYTFTNDLVQAISSCKNLRVFHFMNCSSMNGAMFISILKNCPKLHSIDARCCIHLLSYLINNHLAADTFAEATAPVFIDLASPDPFNQPINQPPSPDPPVSINHSSNSPNQFQLSSSLKEMNFICYNSKLSNHELHHFLSIHSFFSCISLIFPALELLILNSEFTVTNRETMAFKIEHSDAYCEVQASNLFLLQQFILKDENNLFIRGPTGKSLLSFAIECGSMQIIDYLSHVRLEHSSFSQDRLYPENEFERKIVKLSSIYCKNLLPQQPFLGKKKLLKDDFEFLLKIYFELMNIRAYGVDTRPVDNTFVSQILLEPTVKLFNHYASDYYFIHQFFEQATPVQASLLKTLSLASNICTISKVLCEEAVRNLLIGIGNSELAYPLAI